MKHVVIIGGGITGLAAAHKLLELSTEGKQPIEVTVLEAGEQAGGIIQTKARDGFLLERGPDSFITEKPEALHLAQRLGLQAHVIKTNESHRQTFIVQKGRLRPVPAGFYLMAPSQLRPFLGSDIFSWQGKARMLLDLVLPRATENGIADESLAHFVRRRLGQEALERMAQPMIGGIYTADPETLSLKATMPRLLEMERKHGSLIRALRATRESESINQEPLGTAPLQRHSPASSGVRYGLFASFDKGMQVLTDRLVEFISQHGSILVNTKVEQLSRHNAEQWRVETNNRKTVIADAVCLAVSSYSAASLIRPTEPNLAEELDAIPHASSATVNLAYKRVYIDHPLDGFGFVVPFVEKRTLMACTFTSVKFAGRAPAGYVLLRAFVGGALQPNVLDLDDRELESQVCADIEQLLGIKRPPEFTEISRWPRSMPQYVVGHLERVERIRRYEAGINNFALAGNAFTGPGISDCIRSAHTAAAELFQALAAKD